MREYRNQKYLNVNADNFINFTLPEYVYILGFIWADGTILKERKTVRIEIINADMENILNIFNATGKWNFSYRKRENRQLQTIAECNNAKFIDFLVDNDYDQKSLKSPQKIMKLIPPNLMKYFLRGWVDGDGCFYVNKTASQFSISGNYNQDWSAISNLFDYNQIGYKISKFITQKNHSYSIIRISKKYDIEKLGKIIYGDLFDGIGLNRKYEKYNIIKNRCQI